MPFKTYCLNIYKSLFVAIARNNRWTWGDIMLGQMRTAFFPVHNTNNQGHTALTSTDSLDR